MPYPRSEPSSGWTPTSIAGGCGYARRPRRSASSSRIPSAHVCYRKPRPFRSSDRLLNYDLHKAHAIRCHHDTFLDFDLCDSALECHRTHLRLDDYHVRVLTLKEPPAHTFAHLFQALYEIPSNLILVNEWQREGQGAVRREIHAKRRHFHNAKVSLTNYVTDDPTAHRRSARR